MMATATKDETSNTSTDDDGQICSICLEEWTSSGPHRIASLKCGHLFGMSCIEKWLQSQGSKCPQCNYKAQKKDIRIIFAKSLKMVDTSEEYRAKEELEKEKKARKKAELEAAEVKLSLKNSLDELKRLKAELDCYKTSNQPQKSSCPDENVQSNPEISQNCSTGSFVFEKNYKLCDKGGSRVVAYNNLNKVLCLTQCSNNVLFPGYGVKKLSCLDFKTAQYISVHSKPIRDIDFQQSNIMHGNTSPYMLTCSVDKTVKITCLSSNTIVQTYSTPTPAWSCTWDKEDSNHLYVGLQNGTVCLFDMRNISNSVDEIITSSKSPVMSIQYVPRDEISDFKSRGIIIGQLDKCSFSEKLANGDLKLHTLPIEGRLTNLNFEETSRHLLATLRPSAVNPVVRHVMYKMTSQEIGDCAEGESNYICSSDCIYTFHGGSTQKLLSKNRLIPHPTANGNLLVCASDEFTKSIHIWDATTGKLQQKLSNRNQYDVLDICNFSVDESNYLVTLNEQQATIYKWA